MNSLVRSFEKVLWNSRLAVLVAVVASLLVGLGMFYLATIDTWEVLSHLGHYTALSQRERLAHREEMVAGIIEVIDGYLLAATMIIFALGLYELFIRKIEAATESGNAENVLLIRSLDDLKDRLAKMILLMLAIKFFQQTGKMEFKEPLHLLYLAFGTILIAGSIYLSHGKGHEHKPDEPKPDQDPAQPGH